MSKRMKVSLFLSLFLLNGIVKADVRQFYVEVIAFKQSAPNSELFEQKATEIKAVRRYAPAIRGRKTLNYLYRRLEKSGEYRPFYYQSWRVTAKSGRLTLPIEIYDASQKLKGWVKIQRGELLHVLADIELSPSESVEDDGVIYHLKEKRRVLFKEVHYLDHPKFGLIIKVSPI